VSLAAQPWWAVNQAWRLVRWAAREASGGTTGDTETTPDRVGRLLKEGLVSDDIFQLTLMLRGLYYDMRQEPELVTSTAASDFVEAAGKLFESLRRAGDSSRTPDSPTRGPAKVGPPAARMTSALRPPHPTFTPWTHDVSPLGLRFHDSRPRQVGSRIDLVTR
jgi:hypothetical protein